MDGYHVSHDPAKPFTKEPTTGRQLNILDVPKSGSSSVPAPPLSISRSHKTAEVPTGRGLSPSRIIHPKPSKPYASRGLREADYSVPPHVDSLTTQFEQASLYASYGGSYGGSPASSVGSGFSSRSSSGSDSGASSPSSLSSLSDGSASSCRCNRYGITRKGDKVLLDCGGSRCGYSDDSSICSSSDDGDASSEDEAPRYQEIRPKQQVRAPPPQQQRYRVAPAGSRRR